MRKIFLIIICLFFVFVNSQVFAQKNYDYQVYSTKELQQTKTKIMGHNKILFIVDFSNSMNEKLEGRTKLHQAFITLETLLPQIPENTEVGLRVYGQRAGFTYYDGCTASKLLVPLGKNNSEKILGALYITPARGWTPITHSLKQAVNVDFAGVEGKKHIILLTDGGENCDESPCVYAIELMKMRDDISIDVIAFDVYDAEAMNQLKCTAYTTSGKFFTPKNQNELMKSLSDSLNIDKDVKGKVKVKEGW